MKLSSLLLLVLPAGAGSAAAQDGVVAPQSQQQPKSSDPGRRGLELPASSRPTSRPADAAKGAADKSSPGKNGAAGTDHPQSDPAAPRADVAGPEPFAGLAELESQKRAAFIIKVLGRASKPTDPIAVRARDELRALSDTASPSILEGLRSSHGATVAVCAQLAVEQKLHDAAPLLLDALRRGVAPDQAKLLVDGFVDLTVTDPSRPLLDLLDHRSAALRGYSFEALRRRVRVEHVPDLLKLAASSHSETRTFAARLLALVPAPESVDPLLSLLADSTPAVAYAAADALALHNDARVSAELESRIAKAPLSRLFGYACVALSLREERAAAAPSPALAPRLVEGVSNNDPFVAAAAATVLASIGYRSESAPETAYLETKVVPALIVAAGGERFFAEFSSIHDLAIRRLIVLTDKNFGQDGPAWARWWREQRETFRANRASLRVTPENMHSAVVDFECGSERFTLRAEKGTPGPGATDLQDYVLSDDDMRALFDVVRAKKLLDGSSFPIPADAASRPAAGAAKINITLRCDSQRKVLSAAAQDAGPDPAALDAVAAECRRVAQENRWQRYYNNLDLKSREDDFTTEREFLTKEKDPGARQGRLMSRILNVLPQLPAHRRGEAFRDLAAIPGIENRLSSEWIPRLVPLISDGDRLTDGARELLDIFSKLKNKDIFIATFDRLAELRRSDARVGLALAFDRAPRETVVTSLDSPRSVVRAAAVEWLGKNGGAASTIALLEKLTDPSEEVRIEAVRALGERRETAALEKIVAIESLPTTPLPLRRAAIDALGKLGGASAMESLWRATTDLDAGVRRSAFSSLGALRDPVSGNMLVSAWVRALVDPAIRNEELTVIRSAMIAVGGDSTRDALRRSLDPARPRVRREAAIALAELDDPTALPILLEELKANPDAGLRGSVIALTCADLFDRPDPLAAYQVWFDAKRSFTPAAWFVEACATKGIGTGLTAGLIESSKPLPAVPALVDVFLRADDWYLRVRAAHLLVVVTKASFGDVDRFTSLPDRKRIAEQYLALYEKRR